VCAGLRHTFIGSAERGEPMNVAILSPRKIASAMRVTTAEQSIGASGWWR